MVVVSTLRHAKVFIGDCAQYIIRGARNRRIVLAQGDNDREFLDALQKCETKCDNKEYASCLMISHIPLALDPGAQSKILSLVMAF